SILLTYDEEVLIFNNYFSKNFDGTANCNGWLAHGYDAISRKGEIEITMVLEDNGNGCPVVGTDPVAVGTICFDIVQQGASPNIRFDLAHSQFNTNALNDGSAPIPIAQADFIDEKNILICDCPGTGSPCDDGNIYTVNDRYDVYCHCLGQYADSDEDGIPDGVDECLDQVYEAEEATLHEVAVRNNQPQYSGSGFVDYLHSAGDYIQFEVDVPDEGIHQLAFRYALETGSRPLELTIDGNLAEPTLDFLATGSWSVWDTTSTTYFLNAGHHTIRLTTIGLNGANVDQLILSFCSGCAQAGTPCDDGDPCTTNDVIGADCNCGGLYLDTDFDGVCNELDQCEGFDDLADADADGLPDACDPCDNALIGTPCDDGDPCTTDDRYLADCQCLGTFDGPDSDGDGVCDEFDICPSGNDALDADADGLPDACDPCDDRLIGTPCDDGDPCTLLDVTTANCNCQGFFFDSDADGVCSALDQCEGFDDTIDQDADGLPDACDTDVAISPLMEVGKVFDVGQQWQTIVLQNTYQEMVVVATPVLPDNTYLPVVTRVRNASGNHFELRVQNPGGTVADTYPVHFVVVEQGIYTTDQHGIKMEAQKVIAAETARSGNFVREERTFLQAYSNPVVLGQVMTFNDTRWSVFWASGDNSRSAPPDSTHFAAGKIIAQDTVTERSEETIGFIVVEAGNYRTDGLHLEAFVGANTVLGTQNSETGSTYNLQLESANHTVLSTAGVNGGDGGWPVLFSSRPHRGNVLYLAFDEDQILDTERFHISEEVAYLAFEFTHPLSIAAVETTATSCHGSTDGTASVSVAGGDEPYQYLWSNGATEPFITGLSAGTYSVSVTDANGTLLTASAVVEQPPAIGLTMQGGAVTCFGENDGYALAFSFGGTGSHTFLWSNGAVTAEISGLAPGSYAVTVTDANGCTATGSYEVLEPDSLQLSTTATDVICFGENNGTASASSTGGTGAVTYHWSTGATTPVLTGLAAGEYTVTATDGNGCAAEATVVVGQPPLLQVAVVTTFTTCNGGADGTATASYSGGWGDVTYLWSNGATTAHIDSLATGTYTVTVTDANGCTATATADVTDPASLNVETEGSDLSCFEMFDGSVSASHSGGTGDVEYLWSTGATTRTITDLPAGEYTITVTDENGCTATATEVLHQPDPIAVGVVVEQVRCFGGNDGAASLQPSGGTGAYLVAWQDGQTGLSIDGLSAGAYGFVLEDENGCQFEDTLFIDEPEELIVSLNVQAVSCFGGSDGAIAATVNGGHSAEGAVTFLWNTGATLDSLTGLPAGTYAVTVTDVEGCTGVAFAAIGQPDNIIINLDQITPATGNNADGAIEISVFGGTGDFSFEWYLNNELISQEEDPTGLVAGVYFLLFTDANGCQTVFNIEVESVTTAQERNLLRHIRLTPNPTPGPFVLVLDLPRIREATVEILDVSGKIILSKKITNGRHNFNLTNHPAGVYLLQIQIGNTEVVKRIVVM
ncbi:MAG TPA: T9SS type A sorting domain-containing protein, partial [Bacteroidetes bacterium]|nr:T9SS type A sorting domain-containing protein [Bacteroidota bacterium]